MGQGVAERPDRDRFSVVRWLGVDADWAGDDRVFRIDFRRARGNEPRQHAAGDGDVRQRRRDAAVVGYKMKSTAALAVLLISSFVLTGYFTLKIDSTGRWSDGITPL